MGSHAPRAGTATSPSSKCFSSAASSSNESHRAHLVLLLPFRGWLQGHTSPMLLQFARRRLVCHGLRPMLVTSRYVVLPTVTTPSIPFRGAAISDDFNDAGHA